MQARDDYLRRYETRPEYDSTFTSVLGLQFDVAPMHFHGNAMVLKCTSSMLSTYWQSTEVGTHNGNPSFFKVFVTSSLKNIALVTKSESEI